MQGYHQGVACDTDTSFRSVAFDQPAESVSILNITSKPHSQMPLTQPQLSRPQRTRNRLHSRNLFIHRAHQESNIPSGHRKANTSMPLRKSLQDVWSRLQSSEPDEDFPAVGGGLVGCGCYARYGVVKELGVVLAWDSESVLDVSI